MSHFFSFQQALFSELGLLECFIGTTFQKKESCSICEIQKKKKWHSMSRMSPTWHDTQLSNVALKSLPKDSLKDNALQNQKWLITLL